MGNEDAKTYTATEIMNILGAHRNSIYYRFRQPEYQEFITENSEGVKALNEKGFEKIKKDLIEAKIIEPDSSDRDEENINVTSLDSNELLKSKMTIERLEDQIKFLEEKIEMLNHNNSKLEEDKQQLTEQLKVKDGQISSMTELNRNNQVLLLENKKKSLFQRLFNKDDENIDI